jgi:predicted extracellular nuclease
MFQIMIRFVAAALLCAAGSVNAHVVISQVYGGGGSSGAAYRSDFVELHNNGDTSIDLTGWSLQYAEEAYAPGPWQSTNLGGSIAPGGFYLVKLADGSDASAPVLPAPDAIGTITMNNAGGTLMLRNTQTVLDSVGCPLETPGWPTVDVVGFGTAQCADYLPTSALTDTTSLFRKLNGCFYHTDVESFVTGAPAPRNTQSEPRLCHTGPLPTINIYDASVVEGTRPNAFTQMSPFVISLSEPAGPGGIRFALRTIPGTANGNESGSINADYNAQSVVGYILEGQTAVWWSIAIYADPSVEADETFQLELSDISGAIAGDLIATGTIINDDTSNVITPISQIQGSGTTSPLNGRLVMTEGVVTAMRPAGNAFFLQSTHDDGNPATSEGLYVFSSGLPSWLQTGARIRISGVVTEQRQATSDPTAATITQIRSISTLDLLESGVALPEAITLTGADLAPGSAIDNVEKYEAMRMRVDGARVVGASTGFIDEITATATTAGIFRVVLPGVPRTFREPGIDVYDTFPIPAGKVPPRFDHNNERLTVRSNGQLGAPALAVNTGATVNNMTGVLDYYLGSWALLPDIDSGTVTGSMTAQAVSNPRAEDVTIGSFNLFRFFDEVNDNNGAPTLTAEAFDKRLTKTSLALCDYLKTPDIVGIVEAENLRVLNLLAERVNATCAAGPGYAAALLPGNDASGTNVGFLFSRRVMGGQERIVPSTLSQLGKNEVFTNPDGTTVPLLARPPLMMQATAFQSAGAAYPLTVIVNDLQSIADVGSRSVGSNGWTTVGERVRALRLSQAAYLANVVQSRQVALPNERIILLGNFNAYGFNDGYADVMGVLRGNAAAQDQVITYASSPLSFPLIDGAEFIIDPTERYAQITDGNALTFDHILLNSAVVMGAEDIRVEHARINTDFGTHLLGEPNTAIRASNRDPVRIAISVPGFRSADLRVAITNVNPATPRVGQPLSFTVTANNAGPNDAQFPAVSLLVFGPRTTSVNYDVVAPSGWSCGPSPFASSGFDTTAVCTASTLASGASATFTMTFELTPETTGQTVQFFTAVRSQITDPVIADNIASTGALAVAADTDLSAQWTGVPPAPLAAGAQSEFILTVRNLGPDPSWAPMIVFTADAPSGTLIANPAGQPEGWFCQPDFTSPTFRTVCQLQSFIPTVAAFPAGAMKTFSVSGTVPAADADGLNLSATVTGPGSDTNLASNEALLSLPVTLANSDLSVQWTKTPAAPLRSGLIGEFALTLSNAGPDPAQRSSLIITADAPANDVTIEAPAGWACQRDNGDLSRFAVECINYDEEIAVGADVVFNLQIRTPLPDADGLNVTATISSIGTDDNPGNDSSARSVAVKLADADLSAKWSGGPTGPYRPGDVAEFVLTLDNRGRDAAWTPTVSIAVDAPFENVTFGDSGNWSCEGDYSTTDFKINCIYGAELAPRGQSPGVFVVQVVAPPRDRNKLNLKATIDSAYVKDSNRGNNTSRRRQNINGPPGNDDESPED